MNDAPTRPEMHTPAILLMAPQMGENIGASARVMANFGFSDMRVIAPRDGWPNEKATAMSAGAHLILDEARLAPTLSVAGQDLTHVFATAGRSRDIVKEVLTPREAAARMRAILAAGGRPGVLFGPERTGLETAEIVASDAIITDPVNPAFTSLNLGQAVGVMCYEWAASAPDLKLPDEWTPGAPPTATREELEGLVGQLFAELDDANWFWPERKGPSMRNDLRGAFLRAGFTSTDVRALRGVVKTLVLGPKRRTIDSRLDNARTLSLAFVDALAACNAPALLKLVTDDVQVDWLRNRVVEANVVGTRALDAVIAASSPIAITVETITISNDRTALHVKLADGTQAITLLTLKDGRVAQAIWFG